MHAINHGLTEGAKVKAWYRRWQSYVAIVGGFGAGVILAHCVHWS